MIRAEVIQDSIQANGQHRLTSMLLTMPRYVLAEFNTHRSHSRNAASSRAIPVWKRMKMVEVDPFVPLEWGLDRPGMQAGEVASPEVADQARAIWLEMRDQMLAGAKRLADLQIHKQIGNRLLEPFSYVTVLATATEPGWENFLALRAAFPADPGIRDLAYLALDAYNLSLPKILQPGEWHIPFGEGLPEGLSTEERMKVVVARAARLSYNQFDGSSDPAKDRALHDKLAGDGHWSAFEHVAKAPEAGDSPDKAGNLVGWVQLRKLYPGELREDPRVLATRIVDGKVVKEPRRK